MPYAFFANPSLDRSRPYGRAERQILSLEAAQQASNAITAWPGYMPTPLVDLPEVAAELGIAKLSYKHEAHRFGLKSFKALGGAYAVERLIASRGGAADLVVTSATDGNHGRSVAWGAQRLGIRAIIYIHETVSQGRADAIAAYGAEVRRVPGNYDDAVRAATEAAKLNGWVVVSDTSWPGYETIPKDVMQGYAVMPWECEAQGATPTHVIVQGGVGGMAAAVLSYEWERHGAGRPIFVIVEPDTAACLFESAKARKLVTVTGDLDTIMAGLACGEPSLLAWRILQPGADAFMTISDGDAADAMLRLALCGIVGGESGVAGLAGLRQLAQDPAARQTLKLDQNAHVLCYGTEGATDPAVYLQIVGRAATSVEQAAA
jgi:diaminopropionate ammonia-lyase